MGPENVRIRNRKTLHAAVQREVLETGSDGSDIRLGKLVNSETDVGRSNQWCPRFDEQWNGIQPQVYLSAQGRHRLFTARAREFNLRHSPTAHRDSDRYPEEVRPFQQRTRTALRSAGDNNSAPSDVFPTDGSTRRAENRCIEAPGHFGVEFQHWRRSTEDQRQTLDLLSGERVHLFQSRI